MRGLLRLSANGLCDKDQKVKADMRTEGLLSFFKQTNWQCLLSLSTFPSLLNICFSLSQAILHKENAMFVFHECHIQL